MQFAPTISSPEINQLELNSYSGSTLIVDTPELIGKAISELNEHSILGFDTESKPVFVKGQYNPISLIQIASTERVYLFRINKTGFDSRIIDILSNPAIKKIGIGLKDDIVDLRKIQEFNAQSFEEVNQLVKPIGIESNGLRKLTAIILKFRISKNAQVSNWEAEKLTSKQIRYAATDAWVCLEMYNKLKALKLL
jgi:ribonuclease D